jgi:hypothetical protein
MDEAEALIKRGWDDNCISSKDCTVYDGAKFLRLLTGDRWVKEYGSGILRGPYIVQEWYNDRTRYNHFLLPDFDSLRSSITVKEGYCRSTRVYECLKDY